MILKAIRPTSLQESVYEQLMKVILAGKILPGTRITLESLAKQLDVSIMPVREAIRRLEAENFIAVHRRRIIVNELSPENVKNILETRLVLESYAAEKASQIRSEESVNRLEELMQVMEKSTNPRIFSNSNKQFHDTIYTEAGVPIILELVDSLWKRYSPYLYILQNASGWDNSYFIQTHRGMLKAMQEKSSVEVRKWLEKDLTRAANLILGLLEKEHGN